MVHSPPYFNDDDHPNYATDLSLDARLLYVSSSIVDILGYSPQEVIGKSCWEYFHPDEIPFARAIHGRGVQLDKAAVLNYCKIRDKRGIWIGCECVFTIVYDVLVASTSIYRRGSKSLSMPTRLSPRVLLLTRFQNVLQKPLSLDNCSHPRHVIHVIICLPTSQPSSRSLKGH